MTELRECPFKCKENLTILREDHALYFIGCYCGARGPSSVTKAGAIEKWNTRHEPKGAEGDPCQYYGEGGVMNKPSCAKTHSLMFCGKECPDWAENAEDDLCRYRDNSDKYWPCFKDYPVESCGKECDGWTPVPF